MKFNRVPREDYRNLIGQIDSLKSNISQILTSNRQSNKSTARFPIKEQIKSPNLSKTKTNRSVIVKKSSDKKPVRSNKQNLVTEHWDRRGKESSSSRGVSSVSETRLIWRLMQVQESNQQMKKFALMLQQMLRIQIQKRKRLEKALKVSQQKASKVQDVQTKRSTSHFKIFTPQLSKQKERQKQSKTRDQGGQIQSFLLGDCDNYNYSSPPKKRNNGQLQIMQLLQQVSKPTSMQRQKQLKAKLLMAVNKFLKK